MFARKLKDFPFKNKIFIFRIFRKFKNKIYKLFTFFKIVWEHEDWDYSYYLKFNIFLLKRIKLDLDNNKYIEVDKSEITIINNIILAGERLLNDDYIDEVGYKDGFQLIPVEGKNLGFTVKYSYTKDEFKAIQEKAAALKNKDKEIFFNGIKDNYETWWS